MHGTFFRFRRPLPILFGSFINCGFFLNNICFVVKTLLQSLVSQLPKRISCIKTLLVYALDYYLANYICFSFHGQLH